jgi:hypothetical protein
VSRASRGLLAVAFGAFLRSPATTSSPSPRAGAIGPGNHRRRQRNRRSSPGVGRAWPRFAMMAARRGSPIPAGRSIQSLGPMSPLLRVLGVCTLVTVSLVACSRHEPPPVMPSVAASIPRPSTHPFAGLWKDEHCDDDFGLAIAPAGPQLYSVSFCGPGGCFEPGTYRPNTTLVGDPMYRIIDQSTIEVSGQNGDFQRYVRCPGE